MPLQPHFYEGEWSAICDRCGWRFRSSQLRLEPRTKYRVCGKCWDPIQLQEKPIRIRERGALPWARPEPAPVFVPSIVVLQDESGQNWELGVDTDGNDTGTPTTRTGTRFIVFSNYLVLTMSTEGIPTVYRFDSAIHGLAPMRESLEISDANGNTYALTLSDTGETIHTPL